MYDKKNVLFFSVTKDYTWKCDLYFIFQLILWKYF